MLNVLRKIKRWSYLLLVVVLAALVLQFYCESKRTQRQVRALRTAALEDAAHDTGATVATTARPSTLEREAEAAVGEAVVERLKSVSSVESVATAGLDLASASNANVHLDGQLLVVREEHGRFTVTGEAKDETTAQVTLSQRFEYGLVRFQGEGDALVLNVKELSPLDGSTLTSQTVPLDQFIVAPKPGGRWRDRFGWQVGCGVGLVADMDDPLNVYCGAGWGINF